MDSSSLVSFQQKFSVIPLIVVGTRVLFLCTEQQRRILTGLTSTVDTFGGKSSEIMLYHRHVKLLQNVDKTRAGSFIMVFIYHMHNSYSEAAVVIRLPPTMLLLNV